MFGNSKNQHITPKKDLKHFSEYGGFDLQPIMEDTESSMSILNSKDKQLLASIADGHNTALSRLSLSNKS